MDSKYSTGVVWQDFQHKQLMDLFLKLRAAKQDKTDKDIYPYTLAFLAMYVNHHFSLEEEYMDIYCYPDKHLHEDEHRKLVKEIKAFRDKHAEYSEAATDELVAK